LVAASDAAATDVTIVIWVQVDALDFEALPAQK
jgi:hypothetical protein